MTAQEDINRAIATLKGYIKQYDLKKYLASMEELLAQWDDEACAPLYLLNAQLKLLASDDTFEEDLQKAIDIDENVFVEPIFNDLEPMDPNGFFIYKKEDQAVSAYLETLHRNEAAIKRYFGEMGDAYCRQIEGEIQYFRGNIEAVITQTEPQLEMLLQRESYALAMMAGYLLLRAYLASGDNESVEDIFIQLIQWTKISPDAPYSQMYHTIRDWTNLTTGWSGDTPRYHVTPNGMAFPALEDRKEAILKGIHKLGPKEEPLYDFMQLLYPSVCSMRELYMHIFNAMANFSLGRNDEALKALHTAYCLAAPNGIIMPFIETGKHITHLLDYAKTQEGIDPEWIKKIYSKANQYEVYLAKFRGERI